MAFGWDDAFLLSMQAAGAIVSSVQASKSQKYIQMGRELENAALETNLEAIRAESAESSLQELKQLRKNVATQITMNAARGVASGAGSAQTALQSSERNYLDDERIRRMNLLARESELRASNVLSGLHTLSSETMMGQSLTSKIFDTIPIAGLFEKFANKKQKVLKSSIPSINKSGFGLDQV